MTAEQGGDGRGRLAALVVAALVALALVAVALLTGGSGASGGGLRVERSTVGNSPDADLIVYVTDRGANVPATAGGRANVELQCLDPSGAVVVRTTHPWPFTDTDGNTTDPHVHQRSSSEDAGRIARCRVAGTAPPLQGRVGTPR